LYTKINLGDRVLPIYTILGRRLQPPRLPCSSYYQSLPPMLIMKVNSTLQIIVYQICTVLSSTFIRIIY